MAVLSDTERQATYLAAMQLMSDQRQSCAITKAQLRAAIDAADDWADTNAAAYNSALPVAARNNLTAGQKALVLAYICMKRGGLL